MKIKVKEYYEKLAQGVQGLLEGDLGKFLKFMQNFKAYSFSNTIMIFLQKPHATRVAGFKKWNSLGRTIKRGKKV